MQCFALWFVSVPWWAWAVMSLVILVLTWKAATRRPPTN
jgi:hypothetical protein